MTPSVEVHGACDARFARVRDAFADNFTKHSEVGASLAVMERDASRMRGARPFVFTNVRAGGGVDAVAAFIEERGGLAHRRTCA